MARNLTFLPGTMCDERVWAPVRSRLEPRFSTDYIAIEGKPTRAGMLGLIHSAASTGDPLHLVAFSMGGYLALQYALDNPGRVASLVTVASSAFGLTEEEAAERVRALELLEKHDYRGIPKGRINQFVHPSRQNDPAVVDVIRAMDHDLGKIRSVRLAKIGSVSMCSQFSFVVQTRDEILRADAFFCFSNRFW